MLEKHGPHAPIGFDLIHARDVYYFDPAEGPAVAAEAQRLRRSDPAGDMHAGEGAAATAALGRVLTEGRVETLVRARAAVKAAQSAPGCSASSSSA